MDVKRDGIGSRILGALPPGVMERIAPVLRIEEHRRGTILQAADEEIESCYFPITGVASLFITEASGKTVDTAIIGPEGFVGLPVFLGTGRMPVQAMAQLELRTVTISSVDLRRVLTQEPILVNLLQRYTQMVLVEIARLVLCNRVHSLDERVARWLLQVSERVPDGAPMDVTHEFLSQMVGSDRPPVSDSLRRYVEAGAVAASRGRLTVVDPAGLEAAACDCYRTIRQELDRLLGERTRHDVAREVSS
jgi:CRP-like cAMP-binding protein